MDKTQAVFLSDLQQHEVSFEQREGGGFLVRGLPIIRVGTWNDQEYSRERLEEMVASFLALKEKHSWTPALRPFHKDYDEEGYPRAFDARDVLGYFEDLKLTGDTVVGDVSVDEATVQDMQQGRLRYVSAEVTGHEPDYVVEGTGYRDVLVGAAFVDNPAVKGLNWSVVINADQFAHLQPAQHAFGSLSANELTTKLGAALVDRPEYRSDPERGIYGPYVREVFDDYLVVEFSGEYFRHTYSVAETEVAVSVERIPVKQTWIATPQQPVTNDSTQKGGLTMNLVEQFKTLLGKIVAGEAKPEDVDALVLESPEGDGATNLTNDQDPRTPAPPMPPEDDPRLAQLAKSNEEQATRIAQLEATGRQQQAAGLIDKLVASGHVTPAQRQEVYVLADHLLAQGGTIKVLVPVPGGEEGKTEEKEFSTVALLEQVLSSRKVLPEGAPALHWEGTEDPEQLTDEQLTKVGEDVADTVNEPKAE